MKKDENVKNEEVKTKEIDKDTKVKDISDENVNVDNLDPETIEVEKLLSDNDEQEIEKPDYQSEIIKIIKSNQSPKTIKDKLSDYHDNDIALAIKTLSKSYRQKLYRILDVKELSQIFEYVEEEDAGVYINEMDLKKAASLISELEANTAVNILRELEKGKRTLLYVLDFTHNVQGKSINS